MNRKEHFKLMFDKLSFEHKGVKLNKVLCSQLMWKAGNEKYIFGSIRTLVKFFCCFDISEFKNEGLNPILITFGYYPSRNDHRELMINVAKKVKNKCSFFDTSKWSTKKPSFFPKNIIKSLNEGLVKMRNTGLSFKDRIYLSSLICFYLNTINSLDNINFSNVKKYLCLANCLDLENLLTQYFQNKGIKTYSLMDGAYYVHANEVPIMNIPFENLTSDIQLCWGQFSKDEFRKFGYPDSRMLVVGYPKDVDGKPMKKNNSYRKCIVLLSQSVFDRQNINLLDILSKFSDYIDFCLKLHPSLDYEKYANMADAKGFKIIPKNVTINECIDNTSFDFAIAINSTTYYEALMRGLPCFRYYDGSYTRLAGCDDEFNSKESFEKQLYRIKKTFIEAYQKEVDMALEYAVGWRIDNYYDIFNNS